MTLYEFNALDVQGRMEHVNAHGIFVSSDLLAPSNFYRLEWFYVEVVIDPCTMDIITIVPFAVGERYERMVDGLDLKDLV